MLQLSTRSRYAIKALLMIASAPKNKMTTLSTLAKSQGLSKKYLHSILSTLKEVDILESIRGAYGGYVLKKPAHTITIADILCAVEGSKVQALEDKSLQRLWKAVNKNASSILSQCKLSELMDPHFDWTVKI